MLHLTTGIFRNEGRSREQTKRPRNSRRLQCFCGVAMRSGRRRVVVVERCKLIGRRLLSATVACGLLALNGRCGLSASRAKMGEGI
jgi:hypothetical protein